MEIVNDHYWLEYAKKTIEKSITSRNEAAAKLESMTLWFWGLYTASFTIGVSINVIDAPFWVLLLLASPVVFLIITYWFCVLAQFPVTAEFDPTIPYEIKEGYNQGLLVKKRRFNMALIFTFISALLLGTALFSLSFVNKRSETSLIASYDSTLKLITISGILPKNISAYTTIDTVSIENIKSTFYKNIYTVQENGILNINVPIKTLPKEVFVTITWTEKGKEKGIAQKIEK